MIIIKIGFIGAGKVGFSVGKYLIENGIIVTGYYSRSEESSLEASLFTKTKQYKSIKELVRDSNAIIITTPDCIIIDIWNEIKNLNIKNKFICHLSGSLSSEIFSNINSYGAYGYSIHPMFPISDKYNSYRALKEAFITIEGDEKYIKEVRSFINNLGNKTKILKDNNKAKYHLSSVISSNLMIGLINISINYLKDYEFNDNEAIQALYPLIRQNIKSILNNGVLNSLTGPVERADVGTLKRHLSNIKEEDREVYLHLSNKILDIALEKNKNKNYNEVKEVLGGLNEEYSSNF